MTYTEYLQAVDEYEQAINLMNFEELEWEFCDMIGNETGDMEVIIRNWGYDGLRGALVDTYADVMRDQYEKGK